jgi:hypothetical protein
MNTKYEPAYGDRGGGKQESEQKCTQNSGRERRYWGERGDIGEREEIKQSTAPKIAMSEG